MPSTRPPDTGRADTRAADTQPPDTQPADTQPPDPQPADTQPADPGRQPIEVLRACVGWTGPTRVDVVERRQLRDYRRAIGLPAEGTRVPATFCACFLTEPPPMPQAETYGDGWINGGDRFELQDTLAVGDELHSQVTLTDVREKQGRSGSLALLTFVTEFRRPTGEVAVRHIGTRIRR